jgi:hypothetical protein
MPSYDDTQKRGRCNVDNKQATATLRTMIANEEAVPIWSEEELDAAKRGADAIDMLEWLMEESFGGIPRTVFLHRAWLIHRTVGETFRAYCEARFRDRAR